MESLAILSHKGGVGKTSIAVNLAVRLANQGKNVCLVDSDFNGPSIFTFFKPNTEIQYLNKFLIGEAELNDCIHDVGRVYNLKGKLLVLYADPRSEAIQNVIRIDQNTSMKMLHYFMKLKKTIADDPYSVEYLIIDSSPGTGFSTINVMVISSVILFVIKINNADIIGTASMIEGLNKQLKSRTMVVANQIPVEFSSDKDRKNRFTLKVQELLTKELEDKSVDFLGWIPNDSELQKSEFETALDSLEGKPNKRLIHVLDKPDHEYTIIINSIIESIFDK